MTESNDRQSMEERVRNLEHRSGGLKWAVLIEALALVILIAIITSRRPIHGPSGASVNAPFTVVGADGRVLASIAEFSAAAPIPVANRWLQLARATHGVSFTINDNAGKPGLQIISGQDAENHAVRSIRLYAPTGNLALALESRGNRSDLVMNSMHGDRALTRLSTSDSGSDLTVGSDGGGGMRLLAGQDGNTLIVYDRLSEQLVQIASGAKGGWVGLFPSPSGRKGPWSHLDPGGLYLHPNWSDSVNRQFSQREPPKSVRKK